MLRLPARLVFALCVACLPCCVDGGPESPPVAGSAAGTPSNNASGSGGGGATGSVGQAGGGAATAGTSAGPVIAGAGAGGAMTCSSYADATGYSLPVHIKNASAKTLYLGQEATTCQPERLFQVEDGSRMLLPSADNCHTSCQSLMQGSPVACPLACAIPTTVMLAPGQTVDIPWDGRFGVPQTLPQQCLASAAATSNACIQAQQVGPALFTFTARAGTNRQCLEPTGTCTCTPSANGTCSTPASLITGTIITTEFLIKLEPAEKSPGGAPQYIGLEFKDVAN